MIETNEANATPVAARTTGVCQVTPEAILVVLYCSESHCLHRSAVKQSHRAAMSRPRLQLQHLILPGTIAYTITGGICVPTTAE